MTILDVCQVVHEKPAHKELVKNWLLAGKSVTQAMLIEKTGNLSARLAPRIHNLRQDGFPIINRTIHERDENGSNKTAEYYLPDDFLESVELYGLDIVLQAGKKGDCVMYFCNLICGIYLVLVGIFAILELSKASHLVVRKNNHLHALRQYRPLWLLCHYGSKKQEFLYCWEC